MNNKTMFKKIAKGGILNLKSLGESLNTEVDNFMEKNIDPIIREFYRSFFHLVNGRYPDERKVPKYNKSQYSANSFTQKSRREIEQVIHPENTNVNDQAYKVYPTCSNNKNPWNYGNNLSRGTVIDGSDRFVKKDEEKATSLDEGNKNKDKTRYCKHYDYSFKNEGDFNQKIYEEVYNFLNQTQRKSTYSINLFNETNISSPLYSQEDLDMYYKINESNKSSKIDILANKIMLMSKESKDWRKVCDFMKSYNNVSCAQIKSHKSSPYYKNKELSGKLDTNKIKVLLDIKDLKIELTLYKDTNSYLISNISFASKNAEIQEIWETDENGQSEYRVRYANGREKNASDFQYSIDNAKKKVK